MISKDYQSKITFNISLVDLTLILDLTVYCPENRVLENREILVIIHNCGRFVIFVDLVRING